MRSGDLRHYVNVMRPAENFDDRGQARGKDDIVIKDWPCSIETLSGNQVEIARKQYASATTRIRGYADPARPITTRHYLQFCSRRFEIGFVNDIDNVGISYELLCQEVTSG